MNVDTGEMGWQRGAACAGSAGRGIDFFATDPAGVRAAEQVCASCRVRVQCLGWARDQEITEGVWGGELLGRQERPQTTSAVRDERRRRRTVLNLDPPMIMAG